MNLIHLDTEEKKCLTFHTEYFRGTLWLHLTGTQNSGSIYWGNNPYAKSGEIWALLYNLKLNHGRRGILYGTFTAFLAIAVDLNRQFFFSVSDHLRKTQVKCEIEISMKENNISCHYN